MYFENSIIEFKDKQYISIDILMTILYEAIENNITLEDFKKSMLKSIIK
jgi:hypothetical protein